MPNTQNFSKHLNFAQRENIVLWTKSTFIMIFIGTLENYSYSVLFILLVLPNKYYVTLKSMLKIDHLLCYTYAFV